jgi:hypothetical protein
MNTEHKYDKDFLSKEDAEALFAVAKTPPNERSLTKLSGFRNRLRRLQTVLQRDSQLARLWK